MLAAARTHLTPTSHGVACGQGRTNRTRDASDERGSIGCAESGAKAQGTPRASHGGGMVESHGRGQRAKLFTRRGKQGERKKRPRPLRAITPRPSAGDKCFGHRAEQCDRAATFTKGSDRWQIAVGTAAAGSTYQERPRASPPRTESTCNNQQQGNRSATRVSRTKTDRHGLASNRDGLLDRTQEIRTHWGLHCMTTRACSRHCEWHCLSV